MGSRGGRRSGRRGERGGGGGGRKDYSGLPVEFVREVLGEKPYSKQEEILRGVLESRRTSVVGCHSSGKDWAAARAMLWWLHTRSPSKAVVTGPTARQVDHIVWSEIRQAHAGSGGRLGGRVFKSSRYEVDDRTFGIGFSTDSPYNLQGFHSPNLLVVITEAHAVDEDDVDGLRRLNPASLLMMGNAFASAGTFYDSHHSMRNLYRTVRISAFDTPNISEGRVVVPGMVTLEDIADRKAEWGEKGARYVGGVLCEFPEGLDDVLVSLRSAKEAAGRSLDASGQVVLGCDVARFGRDKTVVMRRQGPVARVVWKAAGADTMETAAFLRGYCERNEVDVVVVDDVGVGGGVVDRLRELGLGRALVEPFIGSAASSDSDRFYNRASEAWWKMAEAYKRGELDTDDDRALIEQVSSRKRVLGRDERVRVQSKSDMRMSPDEADALAMTFAAPERPEFKIWV